MRWETLARRYQAGQQIIEAEEYVLMGSDMCESDQQAKALR
jgi:hypothetical protein